jgi:DNA recombination protein RmuC
LKLIFQNKIDTLHDKLLTQKDEIEATRKQSLLEFEALANKILEEKTHKFTLTNQEKMEQI